MGVLLEEEVLCGTSTVDFCPLCEDEGIDVLTTVNMLLCVSVVDLELSVCFLLEDDCVFFIVVVKEYVGVCVSTTVVVISEVSFVAVVFSMSDIFSSISTLVSVEVGPVNNSDVLFGV